MKTPLQTKLTAAFYLAFGAATLSSLQASAASAVEQPPPTRTVKFADLDLSKPAGVHTLYRRIETAARQVCQFGGVTDLHMQAQQNACIRQAIDGAVRNVNSPALADLRFGSTRLARR